MSRQPSNSSQNKISRQKSKKKHTIDQQKPQIYIYRPNQAHHDKRDALKGKQKQLKTSKKVMNEKAGFQSSDLKLKRDQIQQKEAFALCMKAELKHKLKKKQTDFQKNTHLVENLHEKLQKNYKSPEKNSLLQQYFQQKGNSEQSIKHQKYKKISAQTKQNKNRSKQQKKIQNYFVAKQNKGSKLDTLSRQISQGQFQRLKIQQKQKSNTKSNSCKKQLDKNLVQLFKLYKKAYEVENSKNQQKVQQSNRKTNYNTNRSKNSTAHYNNPYSNMRVSEHRYRGKLRDQDDSNMQKIGSLIKNQRLQAQQPDFENNKNHSFPVKAKFDQNSQEKDMVSQNYSEVKDKNVKKRPKQGNQDQTGGNIPQKNNFEELQNAKHVQMPLLKGQDWWMNQVQKLKQNCLNYKRIVKAEQNKIKEEEQQKRFKKSRFYVQPIPRFEGKRRQSQQKNGQQKNDQLKLETKKQLQNNIIQQKLPHSINEI